MPKTNAKNAKQKTKKKTTTAKAKKTSLPSQARPSRIPAYRLRRSPVHGSGLFATRVISKGEPIIEYDGERISHEEADRRHAHKARDDNHTFLFTIDAKTVVDAGVQGNEARFINHSCDPNCEVISAEGRLFVEAVRGIEPGEELAYDYNLTREPEDAMEIERIFACRCGAVSCRGTMLAPPRKPKPEPARPAAKAAKSAKGAKGAKRAKRAKSAKGVKGALTGPRRGLRSRGAPAR